MSKILAKFSFPSGQKLEIAQGDLTEEPLDAVVNAANSSLAHGGGVAGAIVRRGGAEIQTESNAWVRQHGLVSNAKPAYTRAGRLPSRYIIHAVGPVWGEGDEDTKLASAIRGSLERAEQLNLASLAFPAISTGIFGFPKERAVPIFLNTFRDYFDRNPNSSIKLVRMTLMDEATLRLFLQALSDWQPPS